MQEYKIFIQRIGLTGITNILLALSSLILIPILTKNLSINDYGLWVEIATTITVVPYLGTLGLYSSMIRFLSSEKDRNKIQEGFYSITSIVLFCTLIICVTLIVFSKYISLLFNTSVDIILLVSIIVFFACLNSILFNFFITFKQIKIYSILMLTQTYLGVFIVSYFVIKGFSLYTALFGLLIANLVVFMIMTVYIISAISFKIPKFKYIKEYLSFGIPTIPSNISLWVVDSSDRYLIGIILGTAFVGYYNPGYTLGNIIILMLAPFSIVLPSILPEYYEKNQLDKVRLFLKYSLKYYLLFAIPSAFGLSLLSKPLLTILTTPEIALNGYLITPIVALSAILYGIYGIIFNIIILKKKTKITGGIWIISAILNVVLNILLIPYFGIICAALVTLFTYSIAFALTLLYSIKFFDFDFDLTFIFKSVAASIIMSSIIIIFNPEGTLNIIATAIIAIIVYFISLWILKGFDTDEIKFIKRLFIN